MISFCFLLTLYWLAAQHLFCIFSLFNNRDFFVCVSFIFTPVFYIRLSRIVLSDKCFFDWWNSHLLCFPKCISPPVFQHSYRDFVVLDHDTTGSVLDPCYSVAKIIWVATKAVRDKKFIVEVILLYFRWFNMQPRAISFL